LFDFIFLFLSLSVPLLLAFRYQLFFRNLHSFFGQPIDNQVYLFDLKVRIMNKIFRLFGNLCLEPPRLYLSKNEMEEFELLLPIVQNFEKGKTQVKRRFACFTF
jgi:hypothetical protein